MKDIKEGKGFNKTEKECVPPEVGVLLRDKLTKKLNFPQDKSVFHGLCPINVNDSVLEIDVQKSKRFAVPRKRVEKDPEPNLLDFLDPVVPFDGVDQDNNEDDLGHAKFIDIAPVKHQLPICTTIKNVQTIFHLFD